MKRHFFTRTVTLKGLLWTLFAVLTVAGSAGMLLHFGNEALTRTVSAEDSNRPVVVLDPGHGGFDGGAMGIGKVVEKDLNLSIALKVRDLLEINGFRVVMTRDTDTGTEDNSKASTRERKHSDMVNRKKLLEKTPNSIFISVHQNIFAGGKAYGAQVFYSANVSESELLAKTLQQSFKDLLQPDNKREAKSSGKDYYLLYTAKVPAVLVECGFLSDAEEVSNLKDEEYQSKIAFVICKSVMEFYGTAGSFGQSVSPDPTTDFSASEEQSERQPDPPLSNGQVLQPNMSQGE